MIFHLVFLPMTCAQFPKPKWVSRLPILTQTSHQFCPNPLRFYLGYLHRLRSISLFHCLPTFIHSRYHLWWLSPNWILFDSHCTWEKLLNTVVPRYLLGINSWMTGSRNPNNYKTSRMCLIKRKKKITKYLYHGLTHLQMTSNQIKYKCYMVATIHHLKTWYFHKSSN